MVPHKQVRAWIRQAEADLEAARAETDSLAECHRRYLIQQSYEKAIKALALMWWKDSTPAEMAQFDHLFLGQHSPLKKLADEAGDLYKPLFHLNRQLRTFLMSLHHGFSGALNRIHFRTKLGSTCNSVLEPVAAG